MMKMLRRVKKDDSLDIRISAFDYLVLRLFFHILDRQPKTCVSFVPLGVWKSPTLIRRETR